MKRINLEQGTSEWLDWRLGGVGASEAPMVFGVSPYKTSLVLWREKVGLVLPEPPHPGMLRGIRMEPKAREWYINKTGILVSPQCVEHDSIPYLKASLDGLDIFGLIFCEIKCPGWKDHSLALAGQVPYHYWVQMQYQMLVTGLQKGHYVSFDGEDGVILDVEADVGFQIQLQGRVAAFWDCVQNSTEPKVAKWENAAIQYLEMYYERDTNQKALRAMAEQLATLMPEGAKTHEEAGLKVTKVADKTSVDWLKVAELATGQVVDLEALVRHYANSQGLAIMDDHLRDATKITKGYPLVTPEKGYIPPSSAKAVNFVIDPLQQQKLQQPSQSTIAGPAAVIAMDW